jgi:glycosyl-4,4'-diaponeurosporenoate acyltransferase
VIVVVLVDAAAWLVIQVSAGYLVHRLSAAWLDRDHWLFRARDWEADGAFYVRRLWIRRWKRWLPDAGAVFRGGVDKRRLGSPTPEHLVDYRRETRRAELGHWLAMAPAPLFVLWNPPALFAAMVVYAVVVNAPCIASQRYNWIRIERVLERVR